WWRSCATCRAWWSAKMAAKRKLPVGGVRAPDPATAAYWQALDALYKHPIFARLLYRATLHRPTQGEGRRCPRDGWALVTSTAEVHVHPARRAEPGEWVYALAHCLLHLGLGHFAGCDRPERRAR